MNGSDRDFDRIARAWLEQGPREAPDRAVAAALQVIDTTPQVRRPWRWPFRRDTPMTRLPLLAALVGLVILSIGALLLSGGGPDPAPAPDPSGTAVSTPTPTAVPTPTLTPTPAPVPETLVGGWVAAGRGFAPIAPGAMQVVTFGAGSGRLQAPAGTFDGGQPFSAVLDTAGDLRLTTGPDAGSCPTDTVGTYGVEILSASQMRLTAREDECTSRIDVLEGVWHRSLAHPSRGGPGVAANFQPIIEFTLPEGTYSGRGMVARDEIVIDSATATYKVWRNLDGFVDPCDIAAGRLLLEPGMDAFLAYLTEDPRFIVEDQEELEIDGRRAVAIRFRTGEPSMAPCWPLDGDAANGGAVLTWVPRAAPQDAFWNGELGVPHALVVTEVGDATLVFEFLTVDGDVASIDRETLSTVRFLDALPEPPAS